MHIEIIHKGIVKQINDNHLMVSIVTDASCRDCKVGSHCSSAGRKEVVVQVYSLYPERYILGCEVAVIGYKQDYYYAILLCYVLPLIVLISTLVVLLLLNSFSQMFSAILSLGTLSLYYFILYTQRHKITQKIKFILQEK
ncbi:MAG: SoxR reducing system RseC family protein [Bacteroidaceae bacterium]